MKKVIIALTVALSGMTACAPSEEKKAEELQAEVMALHDSTMAHMGALYNARKELAQMKDSLKASDSIVVQQITAGINDLAKADESMMQWMRTYRAPDLKKPEEALPYLQQEKVKIEKVQQDIAQSLRQAQDLKSQYQLK